MIKLKNLQNFFYSIPKSLFRLFVQFPLLTSLLQIIFQILIFFSRLQFINILMSTIPLSLLICLLLSTTLVHTQTLFKATQFIQGTQSYPDIDITDDNENFVFGLDNKGYSYILSQNKYEQESTFQAHASSDNSSCIKVTGNGNYLLWATHTKISVYQKNQSTKKFDFSYSFPQASDTIITCDITQDGTFVVYADLVDYFIYRKVNGAFTTVTSDKTPHPIASIDMTDDHQTMLIAQKSKYIRQYVWNANSEKFVHTSSIIANFQAPTMVRRVYIEGKDFTVIPDKNDTGLQLKPFIWEDTQFIAIDGKELHLEGETTYIYHSVTKDRKMIVLTTNTATYIIGGFDTVGDGGSMEVLQKIERSDVKTNRISQDQKFLFLSLNSGIQKYSYCEIDEQIFNSTSQLCQSCDEANNYFYDNGNCTECDLVGCTTCQSLTQCSICDEQNGYYLDGSTCSFCDSSQDMVIINGECKQQCKTTGCIVCPSANTCTECDESTGYYLDGNTCSFCDINSGYFINNGVCEQCSQGCSECTDATTCTTCNKAQGYYLDGTSCSYCNHSESLYVKDGACSFCNASQNYFIYNGECEQCSLTGCLNCLTSTTCSQCDTSANYYAEGDICVLCDEENNEFLVNGNCQKCQVDGCSKCLNLTFCLECQIGVDKDCVGCGINGCSSCSENQLECTSCYENKNYFMNNQTCVLCDIEGCSKCSNLNTCQTCQAGYTKVNGKCEELDVEVASWYIAIITVLAVLLLGLILFWKYKLASSLDQKEVSEIERQKDLWSESGEGMI